MTTIVVHYQQGSGWPVCGERPMSYDSTEALHQVTCQKCLGVITPNFTRTSGDAPCAKCGVILRKHPHMKFGILELFRHCDGTWMKL